MQVGTGVLVFIKIVWSPPIALANHSMGANTLMKHLFPTLFVVLESDSLVYTTCEKATQKRVSFPSRDKRCLFPFELVHSDIWGSAPVKI